MLICSDPGPIGPTEHQRPRLTASAHPPHISLPDTSLNASSYNPPVPNPAPHTHGKGVASHSETIRPFRGAVPFRFQALSAPYSNPAKRARHSSRSGAKAQILPVDSALSNIGLHTKQVPDCCGTVCNEMAHTGTLAGVLNSFNFGVNTSAKTELGY